MKPCSPSDFAARSTAARVSGVARPRASLSRIPMRVARNSESRYARIGTGAESASPGSGPAITSKSMRISAMVRAMGPTTPIQEKAPAPGGKCPVEGMRPGVGFNPQIPQKCAGTRMEPPPSEPTPPSRTTCGDGGGFTSTGAAGRVREIPGVAGFSGEEIVCFVGHQKFGRVGVSEENGAG